MDAPAESEEPDATLEQQRVIVATLWTFWGDHPPAVPPAGDRVFVRWVDRDWEYPGWDDWRLVAVVRAGTVVWTELSGEHDGTDAVFSARVCGAVQAAVTAGTRHGRLDDGTVGIEWGLFVLDGPTEVRTGDWIADALRDPEP